MLTPQEELAQLAQWQDMIRYRVPSMRAQLGTPELGGGPVTYTESSGPPSSGSWSNLFAGAGMGVDVLKRIWQQSQQGPETPSGRHLVAETQLPFQGKMRGDLLRTASRSSMEDFGSGPRGAALGGAAAGTAGGPGGMLLGGLMGGGTKMVQGYRNQRALVGRQKALQNLLRVLAEQEVGERAAEMGAGATGLPAGTSKALSLTGLTGKLGRSLGSGLKKVLG